MAVKTEAWISTDPRFGVSGGGQHEDVQVAVVSILEADSDGDIYPILPLKLSDLITSIEVENTAIGAEATAYDIGVYKYSSGSWQVVDADLFAANLSMVSAHTAGNGVSGLTAVSVANRAKRVYELLSYTSGAEQYEYCMALTADTVGTAAGTISVIVKKAQM